MAKIKFCVRSNVHISSAQDKFTVEIDQEQAKQGPGQVGMFFRSCATTPWGTVPVTCGVSRHAALLIYSMNKIEIKDLLLRQYNVVVWYQGWAVSKIQVV